MLTRRHRRTPASAIQLLTTENSWSINQLLDWQKITNYFDNQLIVEVNFFKPKMSHIVWFQLLQCEWVFGSVSCLYWWRQLKNARERGEEEGGRHAAKTLQCSGKMLDQGTESLWVFSLFITFVNSLPLGFGLLDERTFEDVTFDFRKFFFFFLHFADQMIHRSIAKVMINPLWKFCCSPWHQNSYWGCLSTDPSPWRLNKSRKSL